MKKKTINRLNILNHLIEYELQLAGKTLVEAVENSSWRFHFTLTYEQVEEFKKYSIPLLKKVFKFRKEKAEMTFMWFWKEFGLRIKN